MASNKYMTLSNAEIRIKLKEMENEYEVIKNKLKKELERMGELDKSYNEAKGVLEKRTKGKI